MEKASIDMSVTIRNEGSTAVEEVVQIYIKDNKSPFAVRNHSLCAFKRAGLSVGEELELNLKIPGKAFLEYNDEGKRVLDSKSFTLYAGVSQPDKHSVELCGVKPVAVEVKL